MSEAVLDSPDVVESSPLSGTWQKQMMWLFIITDGLMFAAFLTMYGYMRLSHESWPVAAEVFSIPLIAFMTFVLITSSATMGAGVAASKLGDWKRTVQFLLVTAAGGFLFLGLQAYEWSHFIHEGARLTTNPWGPAQFSAAFFLMTGFHGTHVLSGVVVLLISALRARAGRSTANGIEMTGLYWHFVDLVWVFIFTLFYLI